MLFGAHQRPAHAIVVHRVSQHLLIVDAHDPDDLPGPARAAPVVPLENLDLLMRRRPLGQRLEVDQYGHDLVGRRLDDDFAGLGDGHAGTIAKAPWSVIFAQAVGVVCCLSRTSISSHFPIPLRDDPYAWRIKQSEEAAGSAADAQTPATAVCRSCGATPNEGARFCDTCGSQLVASVDTAKYKQVTVLFADVVRSMDIAAAVDVERLREIMTELVERSAAVVQRYGGTVEYTGDGVMALFGAPVALEDHAFRACLAALAIQEEADRLAAEVARRDGVALRLRVGLNSGRVIAGEIGSGSLGYAATGEAVGFAQRMESVAPPGGVMLSESTARLVEHTVMLAEPEWVRIKGADEPVRARRLVAISPRDGLVGRAEASLVGRRWEMAALDALVDRVIGGRGGVVNVVGPPGIGKSRVAREAAAAGGRSRGRGVLDLLRIPRP